MNRGRKIFAGLRFYVYLKGLYSSYEVPKKVYSMGGNLSRHYLEGRDPNEFPEKASSDYFDGEMRKKAINVSEAIFGWC